MKNERELQKFIKTMLDEGVESFKDMTMVQKANWAQFHENDINEYFEDELNQRMMRDREDAGLTSVECPITGETIW